MDIGEVEKYTCEFYNFGTDDNSFIDFMEVCCCLEKLGMPQTRYELRDIVDKVKISKPNAVNLNEFINICVAVKIKIEEEEAEATNKARNNVSPELSDQSHVKKTIQIFEQKAAEIAAEITRNDIKPKGTPKNLKDVFDKKKD